MVEPRFDHGDTPKLPMWNVFRRGPYLILLD
jgi:hypothetical protein